MSQTIFERIISGELKANVVHDDETSFAFHDANPQAPTHILVIPKKPIPRIGEAQPDDQELLGHLMIKVGEIARKEGLAEDGYRVVINNGRNAGESVPHLHIHILGGRPMSWPPG
ncbi:MAG: histidine triad nucleotide-binding protein [Verrucomicrobiales bacterium]|nr:histidine triad nucleotide-binding protein [Verrucomicrobiales bacterium]|tara:strand:- start:1172 stop:1516 length:345 start_codon:yes stop_codon:yes gene_type:complete